MKKKRKRLLQNILALLGAVVIIGLDQWIKQLAVENLKPIRSFPIWEGVFQLFYVENRGAAFGIFSGKTFLLVGLTGMIILAMIALIVLNKIEHPMLLTSFSLIIGGGIGNLLDRVGQGFVVDYLHITIVDFAVFNFADCCVVIGTILLVAYFVFFDKKDKAEKTEDTSHEQR